MELYDALAIVEAAARNYAEYLEDMVISPTDEEGYVKRVEEIDEAIIVVYSHRKGL